MKRVILLLSFGLLGTSPARASVMDLITVDTTSLAPATTGFIDLAFNGGFPATATIGGFSLTGGSLDLPTLFTQGTVSGVLPGTVTMSDDNADYDEGIHFGSSLSFLLTLSGTPSGTTGDVFTLSFFNSTFSGGLLTGNNNDFWLVQFQMDTAGNITGTAYPNPTGGPSFATITPIAPEPSSGLLAMVGLLGAGIAGMRRRH